MRTGRRIFTQTISTSCVSLVLKTQIVVKLQILVRFKQLRELNVPYGGILEFPECG